MTYKIAKYRQNRPYFVIRQILVTFFFIETCSLFCISLGCPDDFEGKHPVKTGCVVIWPLKVVFTYNSLTIKVLHENKATITCFY